MALFCVKAVDMNTSVAHRDVTNLGYQMLIQFRELSKASPAEAAIRYDIDKRSADAINVMSHDELIVLANQGTLCFSLKLPTVRHLQPA